MELPANELTKGRAQKPTELRKEAETFLFCQKQLSYVIIAYPITMSLVYITFICCTAFFSYLFRCCWDSHETWALFQSTSSGRAHFHVKPSIFRVFSWPSCTKGSEEKKVFLHQIPFVFDGQSTSSKGIWDHNKEDLGTLASTLVRTSALALPSL